jgi:hypothetical protein
MVLDDRGGAACCIYCTDWRRRAGDPHADTPRVDAHADAADARTLTLTLTLTLAVAFTFAFARAAADGDACARVGASAVAAHAVDGTR